MAVSKELLAHLRSGATSVCRAWAITRSDGVTFGFTDHDLPLWFEDIEFRADTGLSAMALAQSTGLAVDNTEALGALSDAAVTEADIEAGRFDGAEVRAWLVNWASPDQRQLVFRGTIGELRRAGGAFHAELRGLTEALNRPLGRVYQKPCTAVLGDGACGVDTGQPGYFSDVVVEVVEARSTFTFSGLTGLAPGWFERGVLIGLSGACEGLRGIIKRDRLENGKRIIELWQPMRAPIAPGDSIRVLAGCDKRMETCRLKFDNLLNFQGFPDIPGENWLMVQPSKSGELSGEAGDERGRGETGGCGGAGLDRHALCASGIGARCGLRLPWPAARGLA
ncbi:DUF2163 domain-containing protein [Aquicoccus sp. G2-2]|uniref:DUF2163 domain-containing protein n=1 Tax=Aquicoccus sp. G2-2 TaxID=3092120 RepID=UPI002AE099D5|nr:DUF2163 domain-containing protein [Aquicoccus sp. G2-2]MEA1112764.1 DUF2163 domain-containing protein [Aquicoccus sp. G2-2]